MFLIPAAYVGHAAGLATSALWTGTSLLFTAAGRRIGPAAVNATRLLLAFALLALTHRLINDTWLPPAHARQLAFLALSGIVGLALGDQALFTAFVDVGPRLSMLIMTTAPLFAALFGWLALGETLGPVAWAGIALTVGGVAWVVRERPRGQAQNGSCPAAPLAPGGRGWVRWETAETATLPRPLPDREGGSGMASVGTHRGRGVLLAFIAAACQAGGLLLSKQGMGHGWLPEGEHMKPQAATLLRIGFAGIAIIPMLLLYWRRERRQRSAGMRPVRIGSWQAGLGFVAAGALVGPYLGVWMSLVAADKAPVGVAQTLCSLPPIFLLPFARLVHHEHISVRAVVGAFVAVGGVALLFVEAR